MTDHLRYCHFESFGGLRINSARNLSRCRGAWCTQTKPLSVNDDGLTEIPSEIYGERRRRIHDQVLDLFTHWMRHFAVTRDLIDEGGCLK
jgi:hypothetical protein